MTKDGGERMIMRLPDETNLLPGHGSPGTLGDERQNNYYVQAALSELK